MLTADERRERHRERNRKHYAANKDNKRKYQQENKNRRAARRRRWYVANRQKAIEYSRQWDRDNTAKRKAAYELRRLAKYGLTTESYTAIFQAQGKACPICERAEPGPRGWVVDHCHATNQVRGILCHHCNIALGNFFDDVGRIERAASYLRNRAIAALGDSVVRQIAEAIGRAMIVTLGETRCEEACRQNR